MDAVCSILKCPIGADTESVPFLITVSAVTLPLIFVPDLIFGQTGGQQNFADLR